MILVNGAFLVNLLLLVILMVMLMLVNLVVPVNLKKYGNVISVRIHMLQDMSLSYINMIVIL